jgi:hypothetical protein
MRSMRIGHATCTDHYHAAAGFGCGAGQDRHSSTAGD